MTERQEAESQSTGSTGAGDFMETGFRIPFNDICIMCEPLLQQKLLGGGGVFLCAENHGGAVWTEERVGDVTENRDRDVFQELIAGCFVEGSDFPETGRKGRQDLSMRVQKAHSESRRHAHAAGHL